MWKITELFIPYDPFPKFEFWNIITKIIEKEKEKKEKEKKFLLQTTRLPEASSPPSKIFPGIRVCNPLNVNVSSVKFRRIN